MRTPKPEARPDDPREGEPQPPAGPRPSQPEVQPEADDPVREHTAGDEPVPGGPDPRLSIEFF